MVKLFNSLDKTKVSLLYKVKELHTTSYVTFCNGNNETKVSFCKTLSCLDITLSHTFRKLYFLFGGKKGNSSNFFQIDFNRVVNSNTFGGERKFKIVRSSVQRERQVGIDAEVLNDLDVKI